MANKKKEVYHVKPLNENKKNIIAALIDEYDIETANDIQEALKDLLGSTIKSMMEAEIDEHLGYESYERSDSENYRNVTKKKKVRGNYGEFEIESYMQSLHLRNYIHKLKTFLIEPVLYS